MLFNKPGFRLIIILFSINQLSGKLSFMTGKTIANYGFIHDS